MAKEWIKFAKSISTRSYGGSKVIERCMPVPNTINDATYFGFSQNKGGKDGEMSYKQMIIL